VKLAHPPVEVIYVIGTSDLNPTSH